MRVSLDGEVAVVTGGSAGIGLACAVALGRMGVRVAVVGRRPERIEAALQMLGAEGIEAMGLAADVTGAADMDRMARQVLVRYGRIDILVAAAGILRPANGAIRQLVSMPLAEWREVVETNLTGMFLADRAVLPHMLAQGKGQIINVSSTSGRRGYAYDAAYCASKFGVIGLTESLAAEVRPHGIRVHLLLPGAIETPMWEQNGPIPRPEQVLPVAQVADLVAFLAALPLDTEYPETVIEPRRAAERPAWRTGGRTG